MSDRTYNGIVTGEDINSLVTVEPYDETSGNGMVLSVFNIKIRIGIEFIERDIRRLFRLFESDHGRLNGNSG